ncbi:S41 family peptidase [Nonomuraea endophytica]|uniref:S41 family peptidase n=1 Tax=Nonomuraea endophytica TaxID=714136 RepID=UPI0037C8094F
MSLRLLLTASALTASALGCTGSAAAVAEPCAPAPMGQAPPLKPTTASTLEQAFACILTKYAGGPTLNHQVLLSAAFAGFTQELQRRGKDQPDATMPALTGDRTRDLTAFSTVYQRIMDKLPTDPELRQTVAGATMQAMVAVLHDNHAAWIREAPGPPPEKMKVKPGQIIEYGTGIAGYSPAEDDPAGRPPLFITMVRSGSPAARLGLRPGDVIRTVNGAPALVDGRLSRRTVEVLLGDPTTKAPVRLALHRPATNRDWKVTIKPTTYRGSPLGFSQRLKGDIAYVKLAGFLPGGEKKVFADIAKMGKVRGLILDLRGNGGGFPGTANKLVSAFAHGKIIGYLCDAKGACEPKRTDDAVPLLNLPLVVLTDRGCASACDAFSAAVKDLGLGKLVGARTAGIVSGPAGGFLLNDGSILELPIQYGLGPNKEIINTIGVAPDHFAPLTAEDLSRGHDPGLTKAREIIGGI